LGAVMSMYHNPSSGPFLAGAGARGPQGVASSPKSLGGGSGGGSFSPPPNQGVIGPGPAGGHGGGACTSNSFTNLGSNNFTNQSVGGGGLGTLGLGGSFANHGGPSASPSFQVPSASASFQLPGTSGSLQGAAAGGSFTGVGSFANLGQPRLPVQPAVSFTAPSLLGGAASTHGTAKGQGPTQGGSFDDTAVTSSVTRPLKYASNSYGNNHHRGHIQPGSKHECQDQQCAEEECDAEECGDEMRAPRDEGKFCGFSRRPMLPVLLVTSTLCGAVHMVMLQFPLLKDLMEGALTAAYCIRVFFLVLYTATLGCMAYCALWQPGQLRREDHGKEYARLQQIGGSPPAAASCNGDGVPEEQDPPLPKRCHKTWQYPLPIRRYDHYCRWLTNCIGLLNHREFIIMVTGLVAIGVLGSLLDLVLVIDMARQGGPWVIAFFLVMHLAYSLALTSLAGPIFRLHLGFISRNELANEWKRNDYYVLTSARTGKSVPVNQLSDDEFNERFDAFEYDKSRNAFDKDTLSNCWTFWCTPRWAPGQLGEF